MARSEASSPVRLHVLVACHNRRELTVRAILAFADAARRAGAEADYTVFDDGSTDGTAEALRALDVAVTRIAGNGSAFWSRSMAMAESHVLRTFNDDGYVVWLNDDVELDEDALDVALAAANKRPNAVLVGAMRDPQTHRTTYSGYRRSGFHPLRFVSVEPNGALQLVDTFNGNLVLVPMNIARVLGGIDGSLSHLGADTDYGFRVGEGGFEVLLLPRTIGGCAHNPLRPLGTLRDDWRAFVSVKGGGNYNTLKRLLQKRRPHSWALFVVMTYSLWWTRRLAHATLKISATARATSESGAR